MSDLYDVLPHDTAKALIGMGFPDRKSVVEATYDDLYSTPGLRKSDITKVKEACRDQFDRALDPFIPVAKFLASTFREDYPTDAVVVNFNENIITVGDFIRFYEEYVERDKN